MKRPLTIIGGGLSGLALANGLRLADVPVKVMEAGHYPRHRVCGEFMAGLAEETVNALGLESCFRDALYHHSTQWFRSGKPVRNYELPSPAPGISRHTLDARMAGQLRQRGGKLIEGARHDLGPAEGVIFTCGRVPSKRGLYGLKGHWSGIPEAGTCADLELHLGQGAYVGISGVEEGYTNVCGLFHEIARGEFAKPVDRFLATLENAGLAYLAQRLKKAEFREGSFCSVSGLSYRRLSGQRTGSIGDSYQLMPPFTGNGMTIALESARQVLPLAIAYAEGAIDWTTFQQKTPYLLRKSFHRRYWVAGLLHPFVLKPALQPLLCTLARTNLLPFNSVYALTH
ncbi:MAG: NAD(P)/FAD-dependent oxidoreductase [Puniceicoccaceae bacterium]